MDPKHEPNPTYPGLSHPTTLKIQPKRVSKLCLRSSYLHKGNALSALGRDAEARETYEKVLPLLADEPRCGRLDYERSSVIVNIGNTYAREGDFDKAFEQYDIAEKLGKDHVDAEGGNKVDGMGIMEVAMRFRAFALKKAGKEDEAKKQMAEVIRLKPKLAEEEKKQKALEEEMLKKAQEEEQQGLAAQQQKQQPLASIAAN